MVSEQFHIELPGGCHYRVRRDKSDLHFQLCRGTTAIEGARFVIPKWPQMQDEKITGFILSVVGSVLEWTKTPPDGSSVHTVPVPQLENLT